jgi:hypothetical protein
MCCYAEMSDVLLAIDKANHLTPRRMSFPAHVNKQLELHSPFLRMFGSLRVFWEGKESKGFRFRFWFWFW